MLKTNTQKTQFIKYQKVAIQGQVNNPFQFLTILGDSNIPCNLMVSYRQELIGTINWILINYAFAINDNRYLLWLHEVETIEIKIPSIWHETLTQIADSLEPFGKTKLMFRVSTPSNTEVGNSTQVCGSQN